MRVLRTIPASHGGPQDYPQVWEAQLIQLNESQLNHLIIDSLRLTLWRLLRSKKNDVYIWTNNNTFTTYIINMS